MRGKWIEGYAIDKHTLHSIYIGENEYGHPMFDTKRSEIGELIYQLKYQEQEKIISDIMVLVKPVLITADWGEG